MRWIESDDILRVTNALATSLEQQLPFLEEYRIAQPGAAPVWVACRGEGVLAADGTLLRMNGMVVNITERKWAEEVLRDTSRAREGAIEAEKLVRGMEENLKLAFVGTWDWNIRTGLITSNAVFAKFYGIEADRAAAGEPFEEFAKNVPGRTLS